MSASASLGSAYVLATAPGTARLIFSGHDGSASGASSRIVKLIGQLQLFNPSRRSYRNIGTPCISCFVCYVVAQADFAMTANSVFRARIDEQINNEPAAVLT